MSDPIDEVAAAPKEAETASEKPAYVVLSVDDPEALDRAAEAVAAGECIVLPTDTVYGIGANAFSSQAVQRLLDAKQRGKDMPPPVLIAEPGMLRALGGSVPPGAQTLAKKFWPGALTLILKAQRTLNLKVGETDGTVAVRVPDHDFTRELLRRTGPLAVSSANISGAAAATDIAAAVEMLGSSVSVYLDAGESPGGTASTIVEFTTTASGKVLREGAIEFQELIDQVAGISPLEKPTPGPAQEAAKSDGPGSSTQDPAAAEPAPSVASEPAQDSESQPSAPSVQAEPQG